jgi:hypothetical protein
VPCRDLERGCEIWLWRLTADRISEIFGEYGEVVETEKQTDPVDERDRAKEALTELFNEAKGKNTHIIVERIVNDIDEIVRKVRFPDWQSTSQGERLVQKELRKTLLKYCGFRKFWRIARGTSSRRWIAASAGRTQSIITLP